VDLKRRWTERVEAWKRYETWARAHPPSMPFEQALASLGAILQQFPRVPARESLTEADLRESVRGHMRCRELLSRIRIPS
jgi:hypothetical protein